MYTFTAAVLCVFIFAAILSIDTHAIRENEMHCALSDAVREAVEEIHVSDLRYQLSDDELIALFEQLLLTRLSVNGKETNTNTVTGGDLPDHANAPIDGGSNVPNNVICDPNFSLQVDIAGADAARGLLCVHVKETFTYPNGNIGTVEDTASLLIEQETSRDMITITYEHTDEAIKQYEKDGNPPPEKTIRIYEVESDQPVPEPSEGGPWVLISTSPEGDLTYIPENEALSTETADVLPAEDFFITSMDTDVIPAEDFSAASPDTDADATEG